MNDNNSSDLRFSNGYNQNNLNVRNNNRDNNNDNDGNQINNNGNNNGNNGDNRESFSFSNLNFTKTMKEMRRKISILNETVIRLERETRIQRWMFVSLVVFIFAISFWILLNK